jgi:uncharacterized membrane protein YeaQ/YmgE (transglycosylase-associated protein family)
MSLEDTKLHISNESLLIIFGVGLIAGWLAGQIVQGTGFGIVGDLIIGIVGAFIGSWLLPLAARLAQGVPRKLRVLNLTAQAAAMTATGKRAWARVAGRLNNG